MARDSRLAWAHHRRMLSSVECRARATAARAAAASVADAGLQAHYEAIALDWASLAVTALAQEVMEADLAGRTGASR
jgi:hypothetical protein